MTQVIVYEGGEVQIICPYNPEDSGKLKLLCKDECKGNNEPLIITQEGQTQAARGRFSLHDSPTAGVFTVNITGLEAKDSGKYWCGTNGTPVFIFDYYTELQVTPREGKYESVYMGKSISVSQLQVKPIESDHNFIDCNSMLE